MIHNLIQAIKHSIMSKNGERIITQDRILPESEWSEEVNQAKAFLEKEGFQVIMCGSIDMVGAFNNHVHQIRGLLAEKKILQAELAKYKEAYPDPDPESADEYSEEEEEED